MGNHIYLGTLHTVVAAYSSYCVECDFLCSLITKRITIEVYENCVNPLSD